MDSATTNSSLAVLLAVTLVAALTRAVFRDKGRHSFLRLLQLVLLCQLPAVLLLETFAGRLPAIVAITCAGAGLLCFGLSSTVGTRHGASGVKHAATSWLLLCWAAAALFATAGHLGFALGLRAAGYDSRAIFLQGLDHSVAFLVATCVGLPALLLVVWLIGGLRLRTRYCCSVAALYVIASLLLVALRSWTDQYLVYMYGTWVVWLLELIWCQLFLALGLPDAQLRRQSGMIRGALRKACCGWQLTRRSGKATAAGEPAILPVTVAPAAQPAAAADAAGKNGKQSEDDKQTAAAEQAPQQPAGVLAKMNLSDALSVARLANNWMLGVMHTGEEVQDDGEEVSGYKRLPWRSGAADKSFAQYISEVVLVDKLSKPAPTGLPSIAELLGTFPRVYPESPSPAADSQSAAPQRRAALAALLHRRRVAGPEGTAFMPCIVAPLGATAADDATAAGRVLHVLQGGLGRGLWAKLPAASHTQQAAGAVAADVASVKSLMVRLGALQRDLRMPGAATMPVAGPLIAALHSLAADVPAGRLQVHLCPRIALTAEPPACSPVRFWAVAAAASGADATTHVFVDALCPDLLEALVHCLLVLQGCSPELARLAEAAVGCSSAAFSRAFSADGGSGAALLSSRMQEELQAVTPADLLQAVAAGGAGLIESPSEPAHRSASALQLAELAARQQEALAAAVDASALQLAPDADWMQATHAAWATLAEKCVIQHQAEQQPSCEAPQNPQELTPKQYWEELMAVVTYWMAQEATATTGTVSVARQGQRVCLEAAVPGLLNAIVENANHSEDSFLQDPDIMVVYLEQLGISNEVEPYFGVNKFQLGRLLRARLQQRLDTNAADRKLAKGQQPPANEQQAAPDKAAAPAVSEDPHAGFTVAVGNGLFWLLPYVMYWASSTTLHSGMFDNGRLDFDHAKWMFWGFFCAYLVVGAFFNLLLMMLCYHQHRFAAPARNVLLCQGLVASILFYTVAAPFPGLYVLLRYDSLSLAWFASAVFWLLCVYLTMLLLIYTTTVSNDAWGTRAGRTVLAVFIAQVAFNRASYALPQIDAVASNLGGLAIFLVIAAVLLWAHMRDHVRMCAEAAAVTPKSDIEQVSTAAVEMLFALHNAMNAQSLAPAKCEPKQRLAIAAKTATVLKQKLRTMRRLRLPLLYDDYAWALPQGALNHLMITVPYWLSEWAVGNEWLGRNTGAMLLATAYILLAGSYLEWCMILRSRYEVARTLRKGAAGAAKSHKGLLDRVSGFRMRTLGQLAHWATLMAGAGLLLVLLLESTRGDAPVASFSDYLKVVRSLHAQLISYSVMVFGFSCMILVRWQYTMRPTLPPPRRDVAAMVCSLLVMLAVALPLAKVLDDFQYVPPVAVATTGLAYLALANLLHRMAVDNLWERSAGQLRTMVKMGRSHTSGQHALSCTAVEPGQLEAAEWRLRNGRHVMARVSAKRGLGAKVSETLAGWQREAAAAYADPHSARLGSLALAYPEFAPLLPAVEAGWAAGTTRAHLVPFDAINPPGGAPQYYALGVPSAGALDVYVAVDAAPERLPYLAANTANRDADRLADRVVEAVLLESLIQWQRKSGLAASGVTTAHLHACMWEFSCGAAPVPARVAEELRTLPPRALSAMVHRTPLSIANGVVRNLAALPAALGQSTEEREDLVAELTPALLNSTWQLLTAEARCTLISACHAAAAAAAAADAGPLATAQTELAAPDATKAAATLVTALEIVSYGQQRSRSRAAAPGPEADAAAGADAEQSGAPSWSEDVSSAATLRAASRAALSASAALAVRSAALEQGALRPEAVQPSSSLAAGKQRGWLSFLSSLSTGGSTFLRLLFLAAMGDVAFFPEAAAALDGKSRLARALLLPGLKALQLLALFSQAVAEALCRRMLWAQPGIYTWLLAAMRRPVAAIAAYDAKAALKLVLTFGRHGVASSHLRALATPKRSPRNSTSGGSSESGSTCSGDSDDELGAQLAEEGLAPDSEALLTSSLLGPRLQPDMTIVMVETAAGAKLTPGGDVAQKTAFVVRGPPKRYVLRTKAAVPRMPVWQYDSAAKTVTRWRYSPLGSHIPVCSEVWDGVESQQAAVLRLRKQGGSPSRTIAYHDDGRVKSLSMETALQADNTAVAVTLQFSTAAGLPTAASAFDSATGTMSFANGERCGVELCWRQQERQRHPAAPFPHTVTVTSNGTAWRLDCDPVARNPNGGAGGPTLWPAELVVLASSTRFAGGGDASTEPWTEADAPAWIPLLLRVLAVQLAPSVWQEAPYLPQDLSLRGKAGGAVAHAAARADAGVSRTLLWWAWSGGATELQRQLIAPPAAKAGVRARLVAAVASLRGRRAQKPGAEPAQEAAKQPEEAPVPVLDGLMATTLDEAALRGDPALAPYWRSRHGLRGDCTALINGNRPLLEAAIGSQLLRDVGAFSHLAHSVDSLAALSTVPGNSYNGGASTPPPAQQPLQPQLPLAARAAPGWLWRRPAARTSLSAATTAAAKQKVVQKAPELGLVASQLAGGLPAAGAAAATKLRVTALDSGTYPMDGGGVATCRQVVLDGLPDVQWSVQAELANDLKQVMPKFVPGQSVARVDLVPQWDTQHNSPAQSLTADVPYHELARRNRATTSAAITQHFLPALGGILGAMCKASCLSAADLAALAGSVLQLHAYFQAYSWDITWASSQVQHFVGSMLKAAQVGMYGDSRPAPSPSEISAFYDLLQHYLKSLASNLPPGDVVHSSHHSLQALGGLVVQRRENQALLIWDHGVLMREKVIYWDCLESRALPQFVREQLIRLHRVTGQCLYAAADIVIPCNATFNTKWEAWLGAPVSRISPLLNAVDIDQYPISTEPRPPRPTTVMLSHVYPLKDIVSAIRAAAIIVHHYHVTDYQLLVYGSLTFDAGYVERCRGLITALALTKNVELRGLGKPTAVLAQGWCYLQSSISEGLPISILEAALCGLCVVCTNVGGCAELLAAPPGGGKERPAWFGRLCAACDPDMIAYAQLEVMAMLPSLQVAKLQQPPKIDGADIKERLASTEVAEQRRVWGMAYRQHVLETFQLARHNQQQRQALHVGQLRRQAEAMDAPADAANAAEEPASPRSPAAIEPVQLQTPAAAGPLRRAHQAPPGSGRGTPHSFEGTLGALMKRSVELAEAQRSRPPWADLERRSMMLTELHAG